MAKYENGDIATFYFVIEEDKNDKRIRAWSDDKSLVKAYMEFHKCKRYRLKEMTATIEEIGEVLNENTNDKIQIGNLITRDQDHKHGFVKYVSVPITTTEMMFIIEESQNYLLSHISYTDIEKYYPYLKKKYRRALENIFLLDVMMSTQYSRPTERLKIIELDQLMLFLSAFPDQFGV